MTKVMAIGVDPNDSRNSFILNALEELDADVLPPPITANKKVGKRDRVKYAEYVAGEIKKRKPKFVLLVGDTAFKCYVDEKGVTLKKRRGRPFELEGVVYLPTISGAYADYDPRQLPLLENDIRLLETIVSGGGIPKEESLEHRVVTNWDEFEEFLADLKGVVSYDIETTGLYPWAFDAMIWSIGFGTRNHQWIIPLVHAEVDWTPRDIKKIFRRINRVINDCYLVMHNAKFDTLYTYVQTGYLWEADFDTMLAHYLIDENQFHSLDHLAKHYYGAPDYDIDLKDKTGRGKLAPAARYHAHDVLYTRKLYYTLKKELAADPGPSQVFYNILMPCVHLFTKIEHHGVYIDMLKFDAAEAYLVEEIKTRTKALEKYGKDINWGSPKQVGDLLFKKLKIKPTLKTKTGANSTGESALKMIDHPLVADLLKLRGAKQQHSFFIEGWKPYLTEEDRLHPNFKLHGTVTGRPSCENPNLQQVPRDPRIRELVTAPPGYVLVEVDLSQIELRVAAELAQERTMIHAFNNGIDLHWLTAIKEISRTGSLKDLVIDTAGTYTQNKKIRYGEAIDVLVKMGPDAAIEINGAWKEHRKKAKAINFGYLYGMWWRKFIQYARDTYDVIVKEQDAQASRTGFFETYNDLPDWHDRQRNFARRNGYVRSLAGRKRRLPDAMSPHDTPQRAEAQRQAINAPVQSFASEINLMTALQIAKEFPWDIVRIVGTVHDAILMEVRIDMVETVVPRILKIMTRPALMDKLDIKLSVPIEADASIGPWSRGVELKKWLAATADNPDRCRTGSTKSSSLRRMPMKEKSKQSSATSVRRATR
jgi:DNA polymerase I-like protein with 3'-5' exonuclease and polymerase domains